MLFVIPYNNDCSNFPSHFFYLHNKILSFTTVVKLNKPVLNTDNVTMLLMNVNLEMKVRYIEYNIILSYQFVKIAEDGNGPISPLHDIPLFSDAANNVVNMVVEVPRWTNSKMEVSPFSSNIIFFTMIVIQCHPALPEIFVPWPSSSMKVLIHFNLRTIFLQYLV